MKLNERELPRALVFGFTSEKNHQPPQYEESFSILENSPDTIQQLKLNIEPPRFLLARNLVSNTYHTVSECLAPLIKYWWPSRRL